MTVLSFAQKVYSRLTKTNFKLSFSQCGEDCILLFLIHSLKLKEVQYLDMGTNDPLNMNNTYLLYLNNYRGICVEPDPRFHQAIKQQRRGDILIKAGVAVSKSTAADFYIMDDAVLNTFSQTEADNMVNNHKRSIKEKIKVPLITVNEILAEHYIKTKHLIISLDVEGLDLSILQSLDFNLYRPGIICVETVGYSEKLTGQKDTAIANLLTENNYTLYADTFINSIFVDTNLFK
jgi:FkbM family methyltransferase